MSIFLITVIQRKIKGISITIWALLFEVNFGFTCTRGTLQFNCAYFEFASFESLVGKNLKRY